MRLILVLDILKFNSHQFINSNALKKSFKKI